MKVRFIEECIVAENGKEVIGPNNKVQFIKACIDNVSYSAKVASIISYTLKDMGYELDETKYNYRKSSFFNELESLIVHSEEYQANKPENNYSRVPMTAVEKYLRDRNRKNKIGIMSYAKRRPKHFGGKMWCLQKIGIFLSFFYFNLEYN